MSSTNFPAPGTYVVDAVHSTVGFVAGGVLLAGGVALFVLAPRSGPVRSEALLSVAPLLGPSAGGVRLLGQW